MPIEVAQRAGFVVLACVVIGAVCGGSMLLTALTRWRGWPDDAAAGAGGKALAGPRA